ITGHVDDVPADVRHAAAAETSHVPANDGEPGAATLLARVEQQLHAEADAETRLAACDGILERSGRRRELRCCCGECTNARKNDCIRTQCTLEIGFYGDVRTTALDRFPQRVQVPRAIVDHCYVHSAPACVFRTSSSASWNRCIAGHGPTLTGRLSPTWRSPRNGRTATPRARSSRFHTSALPGTLNSRKLAAESGTSSPRSMSAVRRSPRFLTTSAMRSRTRSRSNASAASAACSAIALTLYGPRDFSISAMSRAGPIA